MRGVDPHSFEIYSIKIDETRMGAGSLAVCPLTKKNYNSKL